MKKLNTLVIGSGAAGLAAAMRLHDAGVRPIALYTEGLKSGTSINTGSDKQTYYKLGMYGREPDSPRLLAEDLFAGGSVHGDIAYTEAALSIPAFLHLANLGVPFPHDEFGQYIGYKTDHDPKRRATSSGPYTSRDMCTALIAGVKQRGIEIAEHRHAVKLLRTDDRCCGAVFVNTADGAEDVFEPVLAENVIFAVGGPGGFYERSVYPKIHTGAIGLALDIGAKARNLPESQAGLTSTKFRWNVSGSYMQVLPRFVSVDEQGAEHEFLRDYFPSVETMYDMIFLKGYQWPFACEHVPGSSLIDLFVHIETMIRKRRVFLDYRTDPADLRFHALGAETKSYLERSGATAGSPVERLEILNAPAVELYREHRIDLHTEMLEIAVCAQHNNGGLAGNLWWESENIRHLFPIGEVNGSHGVTRPGGSALNAGQVGAFRAAEYIAAKYAGNTLDPEKAEHTARSVLYDLERRMEEFATADWRTERARFQHRMSLSGAFVRRRETLEKALDETRAQFRELQNDGLGGLEPTALAENLRNLQLLRAQELYLEAMKKQIADGVGSRGGAMVLSPSGTHIVHPMLGGEWRIEPEDPAFRERILESRFTEDGCVEQQWVPRRPLPDPDGWFENVWRACREKTIYGAES